MEALRASVTVLVNPSRLRLRVRVQPRASRNRIMGMHGDAVKIQLRAPAVDGAANAALMVFLAETFQVRRGGLKLVSGEHSRGKVVDIAAPDPEGLREQLAAILGLTA